ncbi:MAG: hypothetical protein PWR12_1415 [Eubacteriaceae bacterium]|jgi:hypothetical protein|nr:hypothetical protein [Eubacteriaceae bacterium]
MKKIPDIDPHFSEKGYEVNRAIFKDYDPRLMAEKSGLVFDQDRQCFIIEVLGDKYSVNYPDGEVVFADGQPVSNYSVKMIILRYLINANGSLPTGQFKSYKEFPDGPLYYANFYARSIKIFALIGAEYPQALNDFISETKASRIDQGDLAFSLKVMPVVEVAFILWYGDDEFEPEGQILFDQNLMDIFTIKDLAVLGDVLMLKMKTFTSA